MTDGKLFNTKRGVNLYLRGGKKADSDLYISRREVQAVLDATKPRKTVHESTAYDLFLISANLGLRQGEIIQMERGDFSHLHHGYITVNTLKKGTPVRDSLYIGDAEERMLRSVLDRRESITKRSRLFPFSTRVVRHYWGFFSQIAGLRPTLSFHSLRHFAASEIVEAGGTSLYAKVRLRHDLAGLDISERYAVPTPDKMTAAANRKGVIR